jgi:hypothetical protein
MSEEEDQELINDIDDIDREYAKKEKKTVENNIKEFSEFCLKHKAHIILIHSKMPIFLENGDELYKYKCPIPRCSFRTFRRYTKAQKEKDYEIYKETLSKQKF